jgi:hypothetical protein
MHNRMLLYASLLTTSLAVGASAHAETIDGTLTFRKADGSTRPIANATVQLLHLRPGYATWQPWAMSSTNAAGQLNTTVPFFGIGEMWKVQVFAVNPSAKVFVNAYPWLLDPFFAETFSLISTGASSVLTYNANFTDATSTAFFNIADAIRRGADYANANRDPRETDTPGQVAVGMQTVTPTSWYDPVNTAIRLNPSAAMNDFSVLHEYGHYLEAQISGFAGVPATHDGCTATLAGQDVMDPGFAWMEGFADYFPHAVDRALPVGTLVGSGIPLETPSCPGVTKPKDSIEKFVAAALFDLMDLAADGGDSYCAASAIPADRLVFQIFDHELDIGFTNPSLQHFTNAWVARGLDAPMLQRTFATHGIAVAVPPPAPRYDLSPAANIAIFRPIGSFNSQWWIAGGISPVTDWGRAGDVPVPADYDGDGLTDLAIWRPTDGTWWILKSAGSGVETQQWGQAGDIPLPADYDGDNETDYAVYRPADQTVYVFSDGCGQSQGIYLGWLGTGTPIVGDFDGDGIDEPGLYRTDGTIYVQPHAGGFISSWLPPNLTPVMRDYDGDGLTDFAVYNLGSFWWKRSTDPITLATANVGVPGDLPVPADYNGDGIAELVVWSPSTGDWTQYRYRRLPVVIGRWGQAGDTPVPAP